MPERALKPYSFRDKVKEKLLIPGRSIKLPRFLTNEPGAPARYSGKRISAPRHLFPSSGSEEQWYVPPDPPTPNRRRLRRETRSRDSAPVISPYSWKEGDDYFVRSTEYLDSPRASSSPERSYAIEASSPRVVSNEEQDSKALRRYDFRNEKRIVYSDMEVHSGLVYDLIKTIPSVWLTNPKVKEAFIPLLRIDQITTRDRAPTPTELRLIEGFFNHVPDVHIIQQKRIQRKPSQSDQDYKKDLKLSSDVNFSSQWS